MKIVYMYETVSMLVNKQVYPAFNELTQERKEKDGYWIIIDKN
jgi:hypothetical protein